MLTDLLAIIAGFALLIWGADRFVLGAAALARNLGVSALLIGLTIVGFGTSAPEILVSIMASIGGNTGLAIGNAIGSNIANVGLILGATALFYPLTVHSGVIKRELPMLLGVSVLVGVLLWDTQLGRIDGVVLLLVLLLVLYAIVNIGRQQQSDALTKELESEVPVAMSTGKAVGIFLLGLVTLLVGSRVLVWGAVNIAQAFGVSDLVIGLTIVALGTSLPELAASFASAIKGEHDIAIGNVIGSNLYNLLAVMSVPGLIQPSAVPAEVMTRDWPLMLALTIGLLIMSLGKPGRINRFEGGVLLAVFFSYQGWIYASSTGML